MVATTGKDSKPQDYEFRQLTAIESVIPGGIGRSRLITVDADGKMKEVKLQNFFSVTGINFSNVRSNDLVITSEISSLYQEGWTVVEVTAGVLARGSGNKEGEGLFITRYLLKRRQ
ncbi:hypothetical protein E1171_17905 [Cytophagales bacterium RKSG123]|nr:hypothetical protein [Xanthovirga aplysinae]